MNKMPRPPIFNYETRERRKLKIMSRVNALSPEDDICITGISGVFPKSKDIDELEHNLYNKVRFV